MSRLLFAAVLAAVVRAGSDQADTPSTSITSTIAEMQAGFLDCELAFVFFVLALPAAPCNILTQRSKYTCFE